MRSSPKDLKERTLFSLGPLDRELDGVNLRILKELQREPRLSMTELGRRVGLSSPSVTERVRRLEAAGVIRDIGWR